jgi:hypothetical protein
MFLVPFARAECVTAAQATPIDTCVVMARDGARGVWFELKVANDLRKYKLEVPELRLQIAKLEGVVALEKTRAEMFKEAADLRAQALKLQEAQVDRSLAAGAKAQEETGAWYRSPILWFAAGILVTGAVVVAAAKTGG